MEKYSLSKSVSVHSHKKWGDTSESANESANTGHIVNIFA